jgi:hypothetical protein
LAREVRHETDQQDSTLERAIVRALRRDRPNVGVHWRWIMDIAARIERGEIRVVLEEKKE